jgi:hypothetical protein
MKIIRPLLDGLKRYSLSINDKSNFKLIHITKFKYEKQNYLGKIYCDHLMPVGAQLVGLVRVWRWPSSVHFSSLTKTLS